MEGDVSGPQNVAEDSGNGTPAISGKSRLVKYVFLARCVKQRLQFGEDVVKKNTCWCEN